METEEAEREAPTNWADDLTVICALYLCACGLLLLVLDLLHWRHGGRFAVVSPYSLPIATWLFRLGVAASLVAYLGFPRKLLCRVIVVVLAGTFVFGVWSTWILTVQ